MASDKTWVMKLHVTPELMKYSYYPVRWVVRERISDELPAGEGRIFWVVTRFKNVVEFMGLVGPGAVRYGRNYKRNRKLDRYPYDM